jgi:anti-anti-sigma factor
VLKIEQKTHQIEEDGTTIIVLTLSGHLDLATAWEFSAKLQNCIANITPHIVVNLSQVDFIDSSGLTALVAGMRDTAKLHGSFCLCNIDPEVKRIFELTMMNYVLAIFATEKEALEAKR